MKNPILYLLFTCLFVATGYKDSSAQVYSEESTLDGAKRLQSKAKHVVLIGLDGWGAHGLKNVNMPVTQQLMREGAYTLKKRAVLPSSSAVNWATIFMGASPELHGYTEWASKTPDLPSRELNRHGVFPSIFQLYRDAAPDAEIGCLYEWEGIKYLIDTLSQDFYAQALDFVRRPKALCDMTVEYIIDKRPNLLAVIFDNPDHAGHSKGFYSSQYYAKLTELDGYIGRIIEALKEAEIWEDTILIVTSDHGGIAKKHGGKTLEEIETPFIIYGKNIKSGYCFDEISMAQYDCAAIMADILGLTPPQVWTGRTIDQLFK